MLPGEGTGKKARHQAFLFKVVKDRDG